MTIEERIRICKTIEKIEKNKEYAKKLGVEIINNKSTTQKETK